MPDTRGRWNLAGHQIVWGPQALDLEGAQVEIDHPLEDQPKN